MPSQPMPGRVNLTHITPRMGVQALSHTPAGDSEGDWLGAGLWAGLGEGAQDAVGGEGKGPRHIKLRRSRAMKSW